MDTPPPALPFGLTRETKIRIDKDGRFWNEGVEIVHEALVRSLASWVDVDAESGRYVLRNSVNWAFVTVDDAPLVVRAYHAGDGGAGVVRLNDGAEEPLDWGSLRVDADGVPYVDVRGGKLPARFSRSAAWALLSEAREDADGTTWVAGRQVRRVARGEGARRRGAETSA